MALPHGFLDELLSRTSLAQVAGRKVSWDARKSNPGRGDMWAQCPFHQEKTPSFHVDDRKGFYYCFGCHAKGDVIGFVRETENSGFMEAVEILAREAGMQMPALDPQERRKADRRDELSDAMEQAISFYRLQLKTAAGSAARDYLAGRGLGDDAIGRWEIGFAPQGWETLRVHLTGKGVDIGLLLDAGLVRASDKGREPYDVFRNRIMFPIRDAHGRAIAFGGRAMDPEDRAKYLNSPQTELFDKSRTLFNFGPARRTAGKDATLIVAEGYMDVIALVEAGFEMSVAPLGTAVTEHQLRLMWRIADEPLFALDGDDAGQRAAARAVDLALPILEAGKSLRFCMLPQGQDPDDVIRKGGASAMRKLLGGAQPLLGMLWRRETEGRTFDSPERKAALDKRLHQFVGTIRDISVRTNYLREIRELIWQFFWRKRTSGASRGGAPVAGPSVGAKRSALASGGDDGDQLRESVILAALLLHPDLVSDFWAELEEMECTSDDHLLLRAALLAEAEGMPETLRERVCKRIGPDPLETLLAHGHMRAIPALRDRADREAAAQCVAGEFATLGAFRGARRDIEESVADISDPSGIADEEVTWRLAQAAEAMRMAGRGPEEDEEEYETGANGARISKAEKAERDAMLEKILAIDGGRRRN